MPFTTGTRKHCRSPKPSALADRFDECLLADLAATVGTDCGRFHQVIGRERVVACHEIEKPLERNVCIRAAALAPDHLSSRADNGVAIHEHPLCQFQSWVRRITTHCLGSTAG